MRGGDPGAIRWLGFFACVALASGCTGGGGGGGGSVGPPGQGDTTPPEIEVSSPSGTSELAGTTVLSAVATDETGVVTVQFSVDGAGVGPALTQPPWRATWNTSSVADGVHEITAVAFDAAGNRGTSDPVPVQVANAAITPALDFASFLGALGDDSARDAAFDPNGFLYVAGGTASVTFPTTVGAHDRTFNGTHDAYVAKFAPDGSLVYSTFLGGPNYDRAYAVEVDDQGRVTVAGRCGACFPTTPGALQTSFGGDTSPNPLYGSQDGFVARLSADGSTLLWSTYFGGDGSDSPRDMALDGAGNAYLVTGVDRPNPYVTSGAFDPVFDGPFEGLVAEISADGTQCAWASYFGAAGQDGGTPSIRVSPTGAVWLLGHTQSASFPVTPGSYQTSAGGGIDLVLLKVQPGGGSLAFATYFGGSGNEFTETHGLALNLGEAIVAATTTSANLPLAPASIAPSFQAAYGGSGGPTTGGLTNYPGDGFVARFSADGSELLAFTYLGGRFGEGLEGVGLDAAGHVLVGGATYSPDFPVTAGAFQSAKRSLADAFVARFSPDLSTLEFATFLGGNGEDYGRAMAVARDGHAVCVGMTASVDFPSTPGSFEPDYGGGALDAFYFGFEF
ncbi:MAG: Ig-like domain-containing protein [Planctomycetota bacterium]